MSNNPLLSITNLIDFPAIKPEHVVPGMKALIEEAQDALNEVTRDTTPATWDDVIAPLERKTLALSRAWGAVSHLMSVCDEPNLRKAYNEALPIVTQFWIGLSQSTLSQKYKAIKESEGFKSLSAVRQRIINEELIDFKLAGAFLPDEQKAELTEARWLINQYEASQNQALPINTLKDMVNPCQRLVQRLKLIGRHFEFAKIVAKEGFSLEEWAYTCDKTIKAYRVSKMTASTLQAVMDLQDNVYKSELQKLPDIFKGTQVITMLAIPEMYKAPYKDVQAVKKNRRELEKLFKELDYTLVDAPIEIMP